MNEPILSREEVEALAHRICARYIHSENIHLRHYTFGITTLEQFAQAYEAALLEKLCGEPVAHYCEHKHRCKWPGVRGMPAFGRISDCISAWVEWHERECGGRLISLYTLKDRQS